MADAATHLLAGERRAAAVLQAAVQEAIEVMSGGGGDAQARWLGVAPWELEGQLDMAWEERGKERRRPLREGEGRGRRGGSHRR